MASDPNEPDLDYRKAWESATQDRRVHQLRAEAAEARATRAEERLQVAVAGLKLSAIVFYVATGRELGPARATLAKLDAGPT